MKVKKVFPLENHAYFGCYRIEIRSCSTGLVISFHSSMGAIVLEKLPYSHRSSTYPEGPKSHEGLDEI